MRIRLYQLSKELEVSNQELVAKAHALGIPANSHSSTIDGAQANLLRMHYGRPAVSLGASAKAEKEIARARQAKAEAAAQAKKAAAQPKKAAPAPPKPAGTPEKPSPPAKTPAPAEAKTRRQRPRRGGPPPKAAAAAPAAPDAAGRTGAPPSDRTERPPGPQAQTKEQRRPDQREEYGRRGARRRGRRPPRRTRRSTGSRRTSIALVFERPSKITLDFPVTLRSFSQASGVKVDELMRKLLQSSVMATLNDPLGQDIVDLLGVEFDIEVAVRRGRDLEGELAEAQAQPDRPEDLKPRAPVVTLLGHVDHGKTSLLDAIRHSHVVDTESGGITQHIGAYTVRQHDHTVVFLDTPGHEAFTAMRARGAHVTDIAVLVVAADDGVMPQTQEAVAHARAAGVPIVVAINKIDLPGANTERVMQQFATLELLPAKWGGDTEFVEVSAVTQQGLPDLVETLALQAEVLELKADPDKPARGTIIEAELSSGRGSVATVLVKEGTLRVGDIVLCGNAYGRVRNLQDDRGRAVEEAGPSTPVEMSGLSAVPAAGDELVVLTDLDKARDLAEARARRDREASVAERAHVTLENLFERLAEGKRAEVLVILKADVHGSLEVLRKTLGDMGTDEVRINILHSAVGGINDSDVLLADASDAIIIGFHVIPESSARLLAEAKRIDLRLYNVIYRLKDDMKAALEDRLEPERREQVLGHAEIRQVFRISRYGSVAGCYVTDGRIARNDMLRLTRDSIVIYEGKLGSLRRVKDDAREVPAGMECGINIEGYNDIKEGDIVETYEILEIKRHL